MPKKKRKTLNQWIKAILVSLIILWIFRTFFFEFSVIRSTNMENSLFKGDIVFINKLIPGPRMPITLISFPFFGNHFPFSNTPAYLDWISLPYLRIKINNIQRNELIAFNYPIENDNPIDKKTIEIKRCIGLPGDTIKIHDKKVFVNKNLIHDSPNCKYRYRINAIEPLDSSFYNKYHIKTSNLVANPYIYDVILSNEMADSISKDPIVKRIQLLKTLNLPKFIVIFPYSPYVSWSLDYFGPIYVPKKGKTIPITKENIYYYRQIIEVYENNTLSVEHDTIFYINNKISYNYTFKYNYYFVLDDNRDQAKDSRYWGFLPETHIIGKASFVLFNIDKQKNRFLKKIE